MPRKAPKHRVCKWDSKTVETPAGPMTKYVTRVDGRVECRISPALSGGYRIELRDLKGEDTLIIMDKSLKTDSAARSMACKKAGLAVYLLNCGQRMQ
jgi:hypothetical protein